jgi:hypothetical protein
LFTLEAVVVVRRNPVMPQVLGALVVVVRVQKQEPQDQGLQIQAAVGAEATALWAQAVQAS